MKFKKKIGLLSAVLAMCCSTVLAAESPKPWMNANLSAQERAGLALKEMTLDEKLKLVFGYVGGDLTWKQGSKRPAESRKGSAGFIYGIPRLGISHLWETDAGLGVSSSAGPDARPATALPSGMNTAATWDL